MLIYLLSIADEDKKQDVIYIFNKYHTEMLTAARVQFKNAGVPNWELEAEDAVQNAFVKITRHINTIKGKVKEENIRAYLYAITNNEVSKIIDSYYKNRTLSLDETITMSEDEFFDQLLIEEHYDEVVEVIRKLDEKYSTVLFLRYDRKYNVRKIAKLIGLSPSAVYTRLSRAKQLLLEYFKRKGGA